MAKRVIEGIEVEASSGNVFADLGFRDANKLKIKSGLVIEITRAMRRLGLTYPGASTATARASISPTTISAPCARGLSAL